MVGDKTDQDLIDELEELDKILENPNLEKGKKKEED